MTSTVLEPADNEIVLAAERLRVTFGIRSRSRTAARHITAVRDVSLAVRSRQTFGLVGESGSGKSTTGRALLRLTPIDEGRILLRGSDITRLAQRKLRPLRRHMQMVFQDPYASLDPSSVVGDIVGEPLDVHLNLSRSERAARVRDLLREVGVNPRHTERYPYEFSGGQRQRIAIARAIACSPDVIVLDEAVSALDVSTQNQILGLLEQLRDEHGLAYLFISHNLSVVRYLADRTAVMYRGAIVEEGPTERVYSNPAHPYTQLLLGSIPGTRGTVPKGERLAVSNSGAIEASQDPSGCVFVGRCPHAVELCGRLGPQPTELKDGGWVACHLHTPIEWSAARVEVRTAKPVA